jgi:hypothetical protein
MSVSFAADRVIGNENAGDLPENREDAMPYVSGGHSGDRARVGDLMPEPDTDPDSGVIEGDPDKDDGKPDDDANIGDSDDKSDKNDAADKENDSDKDDKDEKTEKKFSYTGLIVALIIAVAVIILLAIMIPMSKKDPQRK